MEFKQILSEDILSEATIEQLVRRWNDLTDDQLRNLVVFATDPQTGKATKQPLTAQEVQKRLVQAGVKSDNPMMPKVLKAAQQGYEQYQDKPRREYEADVARQRKQQMSKIKGGAVRKGREKYYRERGVY